MRYVIMVYRAKTGKILRVSHRNVLISPPIMQQDRTSISIIRQDRQFHYLE